MCGCGMFTGTYALILICILLLVIVLQCVSIHVWSQISALCYRVSITIYIGWPMEKVITIIIIPIA